MSPKKAKHVSLARACKQTALVAYARAMLDPIQGCTGRLRLALGLVLLLHVAGFSACFAKKAATGTLCVRSVARAWK